MSGIVLCGIQEQGIDIATYLNSKGIKISCIVTISESLALKNKASGWVSYEAYAKKNGISLYYAKSYSFNSDADKEFFKQNQFDLMILGGWQRLIGPEIIGTLKYGCVGQHGSSEFLPKGRGRSPLNWSIIMGRKRLVWNLFFITPGIDDGDIIDYMIFDINEWDNCKTMYYKVAVAVKQMLARTIPRILKNEVVPLSQIGEASYYPKRTPEDGKINWSSSVFEIYNLIRAVTKPYPGAFTHVNKQKTMIWHAQPWDTHISYYGAANGEIVEVFSDGDHVVNCCDGLLLITQSDNTQPILGSIYT
jgi:methionyl-tRNA formyltransferase